MPELEGRKTWGEHEWRALGLISWIIAKKLLFIALVPIIWTIAVVLGVSVNTITHTLTGNHLD